MAKGVCVHACMKRGRGRGRKKKGLKKNKFFLDCLFFLSLPILMIAMVVVLGGWFFFIKAFCKYECSCPRTLVPSLHDRFQPWLFQSGSMTSLGHLPLWG